jgi:hypothetical protein
VRELAEARVDRRARRDERVHDGRTILLGRDMQGRSPVVERLARERRRNGDEQPYAFGVAFFDEPPQVGALGAR